jgi:hypothetical protein
MEEEYRTIKGHENYSISNYGNIRNNVTEKILKSGLTTKGYKVVRLNGKTMNVHRLVSEAFIPNPDNKKCVDHIDNVKTNNNVNNLRFVTIQENNFNASISKTNISGYKGIRWNKNKNKWQAQICYNYKNYNLGYFKKLEDAVKARQEKANELFGEYTHHSERIVNLNIKIPPNTKLNINVTVEENEEYKQLEKEFEELIK